MSEGKRAILCIGYKSWLMPEHDAIAIAKVLCEAVSVETSFDTLSGYTIGPRIKTEMPQVKFLDFPAIAELELGSD